MALNDIKMLNRLTNFLKQKRNLKWKSLFTQISQWSNWPPAVKLIMNLNQKFGNDIQFWTDCGFFPSSNMRIYMRITDWYKDMNTMTLCLYVWFLVNHSAFKIMKTWTIAFLHTFWCWFRFIFIFAPVWRLRDWFNHKYAWSMLFASWKVFYIFFFFYSSYFHSIVCCCQCCCYFAWLNFSIASSVLSVFQFELFNR